MTAALLALAMAGPVAASAGASAAGRGLQDDVDEVAAAGATGVLAEVRTDEGRAGRARNDREMPWGAHFRIGSVTKTFTATVALQLVAEGELSLDDTVEEWLPGAFADEHGDTHGNDASRITLTNLLRQTSGLNDYDEHLPWVQEFTAESFRAERFHAHEPAELVRLAASTPPAWLPDADDPAGETRWSYANTNYVLAGMIIERATGRPLAQEVHERIIEPLGLGHTYVAGTSAYLPQPRATGYTQFPGSEELVDTTVFTPLPDATIISTTRDLTEFYRALLGGDLLAPAQLAAMQDTVPAPDGSGVEPDARYGMGISWSPVEGCEGGVWSHGGTMPGYASLVAATHDGSRAVAVSTTTWRPGDERQDRMDAATFDLATDALCRDG